MRIVSNGVQPYIVQTGVDTDGETQEEVTTFRMKLDVSECCSEYPAERLIIIRTAVTQRLSACLCPYSWSADLWLLCRIKASPSDERLSPVCERSTRGNH
ncbi:hypothetical protein DPX16_0897 [Anabarilius grahami]|uniref:Uncharacterized protein n=1 Tax=Anabarilius grahami TaxID=495550 RepID=A0A3N0XTK8_ANAGA|nr:hypothetical protein DPX16_0897 [Anabarilius grahami]